MTANELTRSRPKVGVVPERNRNDVPWPAVPEEGQDPDVAARAATDRSSQSPRSRFVGAGVLSHGSIFLHEMELSSSPGRFSDDHLWLGPKDIRGNCRCRCRSLIW